jgi:hypothetical protein
MPSFLSSTVLLAMCLMLASADDKPSRVDHLQSIRAEYAKAREDFGKAIRASAAAEPFYGLFLSRGRTVSAAE